MIEQRTSTHTSASTTSDDFARQASDRSPGLLSEFIQFHRHSRKWWLLPIVLVLLGVGVLIVLGGTALAPFIYTLF
jgi:Family of unknown function (DUF5989)